jgi:hypothetical protein
VERHVSACSRREALAGLGRAALVALGAPVAAAPAEGSDVPAARGRLVGHPRSRFPLALAAVPAPDAPLDTPLRDAVDEWNVVFRQTFGVAAFAWHEREATAQVVLRLQPPDPTGRLMGETRLDADDGGILRPPIEITLREPVARGQTPVERLFFQIAAHELGHALGLPHLNEPASLMCCDHGALDFGNVVVRDTYIAARRHPSVQTAAAQLAAHYRRFWGLALP